MTSLFELAAFYAERDANRGNFPPPQVHLKLAAQRAVEGYASLEDADGETGTRFDGYGNEIEMGVIEDAVRYLRAELAKT